MFQGMQSWFWFSFILVLPMEAEERWCGRDTKLYVGGYLGTLDQRQVNVFLLGQKSLKTIIPYLQISR
jgi:hypothetical protein